MHKLNYYRDIIVIVIFDCDMMFQYCSALVAMVTDNRSFSMLVILSTLITIGISTGSFELRADGTFREWTIFNQHPAGAAKIQVIDDVFLGVRTAMAGGSVAVVMQTHPSDTRLPAVESLQYQGTNSTIPIYQFYIKSMVPSYQVCTTKSKPILGVPSLRHQFLDYIKSAVSWYRYQV